MNISQIIRRESISIVSRIQLYYFPEISSLFYKVFEQVNYLLNKILLSTRINFTICYSNIKLNVFITKPA